ncbi:hypothetical protein MHBO_004180 [Bonamia ostreae]|uniref:Uncharacterized protein n=1 Tax=Bonamia ostreae TaxID=126728 RepID=A0ABV2ASN8_9EUKA
MGDSKEDRVVPSSTVSSDETSSLESISPERLTKKRKYSSSETDDITIVTDSSESHDERPKICRITSDVSDRSVDGVTTSGSELRSSSESPILDMEIPSKTSDWDDHVFPNLRIEVIPEVSAPYVVFSSYSDFLESQKHKRSKIIAMMNDYESLGERKIVLDCYKYAMEHIIDFEYEHIDHIPVHRVEELYESTKTLDKTLLRDWMKQSAGSDLKAGTKEKCKR